MIAVIDRGKLIAEGTSAQLKAKMGGDVIEFELEDAKQKDKALQAVSGISKSKPSYNEETNVVTVPVGSDGSRQLAEVVRALDGAKVSPHRLSLHEPSLDDVFLTLTGEKVEDIEEERKRKKRGRPDVG